MSWEDPLPLYNDKPVYMYVIQIWDCNPNKIVIFSQNLR